MIQTKSGFIPGQETHTLHTRRRYRLVAGPKNNPTAAPFDSNLWLFHYMRADHVLVASIPLGGVNITQIQNTRKHIHSLQQQGLISQKEFMLHDRSSWPSVTFGQMPPKPQANSRGPMGMPNRGYPTTPQAPPNKRQKLPHQGTPQPGPSNMGQHPPPTPVSIASGHHDPPVTIDEEEDTSRGDMLDHLTPREISQARYIQHHEWMEEVLGSVYPISKIRPVDLGLGLRGELEGITKGLFEPPTFPPTSSIRRPTASKAPGEAGGMDNTEEGEGAADGDDDVHMDPATLEEFTRRAEAKKKDLEEDMERMRLIHQQRLTKIKKTGVIKEAEGLLRANINFNMFGVVDPSAVVEEGGHVPGGEERQVTPPTAASTKTDEEIVAMVEQALKKKIVPKDMVIRWDLETGKVIVGNADLMQEDRDEVMGNTGREDDASTSTAPFNESAKQPTIPNVNNTQSISNGGINDLQPQINDVDVNMDNDDTLMDEPSNFADAFDARDLEDPEESSTTATPHLILPPHHQQPSGGSPMGIPSPPAQALTPGTILAPNIPSPAAITGSPLSTDLKNSPGSIPTVPVPDASSLCSVPSGGVAYTGIPGLGGDQGGV